MNSCNNCAYFKGTKNSKGDGFCRKQPPVPLPVTNNDGDIDAYTFYPSVNLEDWCGEWCDVRNMEL